MTNNSHPAAAGRELSDLTFLSLPTDDLGVWLCKKPFIRAAEQSANMMKAVSMLESMGKGFVSQLVLDGGNPKVAGDKRKWSFREPAYLFGGSQSFNFQNANVKEYWQIEFARGGCPLVYYGKLGLVGFDCDSGKDQADWLLKKLGRAKEESLFLPSCRHAVKGSLHVLFHAEEELAKFQDEVFWHSPFGKDHLCSAKQRAFLHWDNAERLLAWLKNKPSSKPLSLADVKPLLKEPSLDDAQQVLKARNPADKTVSQGKRSKASKQTPGEGLDGAREHYLAVLKSQTLESFVFDKETKQFKRDRHGNRVLKKVLKHEHGMRHEYYRIKACRLFYAFANFAKDISKAKQQAKKALMAEHGKHANPIDQAALEREIDRGFEFAEKHPDAWKKPEHFQNNQPQGADQEDRTAELCKEAKQRFCHAQETHKFFEIQPPDQHGMRSPSAISREQIKDEYGALEGVGEKTLKRIFKAIYSHGFKTTCQLPFMPTFTTDSEGKKAINTDISEMPPLGNQENYKGGPFEEMLDECFEPAVKTYLEDFFRWQIQSILAGKPNRRYHGVYLCGPAGVGKDTLMEISGEIIGSAAVNISQALFNESGFNMSQANFLTFISDASLPSKRGVSFETFKERIKEHVSSPQMALADKHVKARQQLRYGPFFLLLNLESRQARKLLVNPLEQGFEGKFAMIEMREGSHVNMSPEDAEDHLMKIKASLPDARAFFAKTKIQAQPHFRFGIEPFIDQAIRQTALDENHVTDDLAYLQALTNAVHQTAQAGERSFKAQGEHWQLSIKAIKEIHADCLEKDFGLHNPTTQKLKPLIQKHGDEFGIQTAEKPLNKTKATTIYLFKIQ